jgi:hypothetical protein
VAAALRANPNPPQAPQGATKKDKESHRRRGHDLVRWQLYLGKQAQAPGASDFPAISITSDFDDGHAVRPRVKGADHPPRPSSITLLSNGARLMTAMAMTHTTHAMNRSSPGFKRRSATDTPCRIHVTLAMHAVSMSVLGMQRGSI